MTPNQYYELCLKHGQLAVDRIFSRSVKAMNRRFKGDVNK